MEKLKAYTLTIIALSNAVCVRW